MVSANQLWSGNFCRLIVILSDCRSRFLRKHKIAANISIINRRFVDCRTGQVPFESQKAHGIIAELKLLEIVLDSVPKSRTWEV